MVFQHVRGTCDVLLASLPQAVTERVVSRSGSHQLRRRKASLARVDKITLPCKAVRFLNSLWHTDASVQDEPDALPAAAPRETAARSTSRPAAHRHTRDLHTARLRPCKTKLVRRVAGPGRSFVLKYGSVEGRWGNGGVCRGSRVAVLPAPSKGTRSWTVCAAAEGEDTGWATGFVCCEEPSSCRRGRCQSTRR